MKIKELIKALQKFNPDTELNFVIGYDKAYRKACARQVLENEKSGGDQFLKNLDIACIKSDYMVSENTESVDIHLVQSILDDDDFEDLVIAEIL